MVVFEGMLAMRFESWRCRMAFLNVCLNASRHSCFSFQDAVALGYSSVDENKARDGRFGKTPWKC